MTANLVRNQFEVFLGVNGDALDNGFVYVGVPNMNPRTAPKAVFWDESLTIPALQPIRTIGGYASQNGSPGRMFTDGPYSMTILAADETLVWSSATSNAVPIIADRTLESFQVFGGSDETANLQAAFDWSAATKGKLIGTPGVQYQTSGLTTTGSARVDWNGSTQLCTGTDTFLDAQATMRGPYPLTANYTIGSTTISCAPLNSAPVKGQVLAIWSNAVDPANRDRGSETTKPRCAEMFVCGEGSTTTTIVLAVPLRFTRGISDVSTVGEEAEINPYTTARGAVILYAEPDDIFEWDGGHVRYSDLTGTASAVAIYGYHNPIFRDPTLGPCPSKAIDVFGTIRAEVRNPRTILLNDDTGANQLGYGVDDGGWETQVTGIRGHSTRHVYTSGVVFAPANDTNLRRMIASCRTVGSMIDVGHASGGIQGHWDTHHNSTATMFNNCFSQDGGSYVLNMRGRDIWHKNVRARNMWGGAKIFTDYSSGDADDDFYMNGKTRADFTTGRLTGFEIDGCDNELMDAWHAVGIFDGNITARRLKDHRVAYNFGADMTLGGVHDVIGIAGGGIGGTGVIHVQEATPPAQIAALFPNPITRITGDVVYDVSACDAVGVPAFNIAANCSVIVTGRLRLLLPAGATWRTGPGSLTCQGDGIIEYSVAGAADDSIITGASTLNGCRVYALDGTLKWEGIEE